MISNIKSGGVFQYKKILKSSTSVTILVLIVVLGTFLRFYRLETRFPFAGEQGNEFLQMKDYINKGEIPLLGPPTSHPWLSFGPLYYWLIMPLVKIFNFDPLSSAYTMAFLSILIIPVNYLITSRLFGRLTGIVSTFLISVSYSFIQIANGARFFSVVPLIFYPFLYFLVKSLNGNKKSFFWWAFWLGVMFNFHLSALLLIPPTIVAFFLNRIKINKNIILLIFSGFLSTQIPFVLYNVRDNFQMISKFLAWIPYKLLVALGLIPAKEGITTTFSASIISLLNFLLNSFGVPKLFPRLLIVGCFALLIYMVFKSRKRFSNPRVSLLFSILTLGIIGIIIHGDPPYHYFLPLYPVPILLLSYLVSTKITKSYKFIFSGLLLAIFLTNIKYYFSESWFFRPQNRIHGEFVPYRLQLRAVDAIIEDAKGKKFSLKRVGPNDKFEENFAQNYMYLLWRKGNEPTGGQQLSYTIYEVSQIDSQEIIYNSGGLSVIRSEYEKEN